MSEATEPKKAEEEQKDLPRNTFKNQEKNLSHRLRYTGDANPTDQNGQPNLEFTYEVKEVDGPEGHLLTLAQARALRRALEWAAAHDQHASPTSTPGDGEEKPRAA
jgi:hypothetical protein